MKQYRVTKKFTAGILEGLTLTETTSFEMPVGFECRRPIGGSPYIVTACEPSAQMMLDANTDN